MGNIITIDKNQIAVFKEEAGKLVLKKEAENELVKLLDTLDLLNDTLTQVKQQIIESGTKVSPDFKGVVGEKIKAIARQYGAKYKVSKDTAESKTFVRTYTQTSVDGSGIDTFKKEKGRLPKGIEEVEREVKLEIRRQ